MSRYLDLRPSERVLIEVAYQAALREVRRAFARELARAEEPDEAEKPRRTFSDEDTVEILEIFDQLFEPGWLDHCEPPEGFEELLFALDRDGFEVSRPGPRARRLTGNKESAKTRKPRVKRLAGG